MPPEKFSSELANRLPELVKRSPHVHLRVIVRLATKPTEIIFGASRTAEVRARAFEILDQTGLSKKMLETLQVEPHEVFDLAPGFSASIPIKNLERLAHEEAVSSIEPDRIFAIRLNKVKEIVGTLRPPESTAGGKGVTIALLDTGIDIEHPDLRERIDLGNSRNFTDEGDSHQLTDNYGHGTHVAGIAAGSGVSSNGTFRGVASGAKLMVLKVFNKNGWGFGGWISMAVAWAVKHGAEVINFSGGYSPWIPPWLTVAPPWVWSIHRAHVEGTFDAAVTFGTVVTVAAGNDANLSPLSGGKGTINLPATAENVISVGSIWKDRALSSFSSRGPVYRSPHLRLGDVKTLTSGQDAFDVMKPDVVAPGGEIDSDLMALGLCGYHEGIVSAKARNLHETLKRCILPNNRDYLRCSGTSMASPVVAGIAALAIEEGSNLGLNWGGLQRANIIKNLIMRTAEDLGLDPTEQGRGCVSWPNVRAVLAEMARDPDLLRQYMKPWYKEGDQWSSPV